MIDAGIYVKAILNRRNMSQMELLKKMRKLELADDKTLVKQKLNNAINIRMGYTWARRIEIALDLPEYSLINMVGTPTEYEWKKIKEIRKHVKE